MKDFQVISWEELVGSGNCFFPQGTAVTIGSFDGPHKGHNELFKRVLNRAEEEKIPSGIVTFFRPPAAVKNAHYAGDVSTLRLKLKKIADLGFNFVILIDFSSEFARIGGETFFDILIKTIRLKYLAAGEDFSCGYRRELKAAGIKRLALRKGFRFDSIKPVHSDGIMRISSTAIRNAVLSADFTRAEHLLGYSFLFDVIGPAWIITGEYSVCAPRAYITQILPECGRYKVSVKTVAGAQADAFFFINENEVTLRFEKKASPQFALKNMNDFDTVKFICKE